MRIPCAQPIPFLVSGLSFLQPVLTNIQFDNMLMVATALVLGSGFNLSRIHQMWLKRKAVSTLSYFLSDAKFSTQELQLLYIQRIQQMYSVPPGCFLIDDTMKHHTKLCKWIHGVFVLFDHALGTNCKTTCIVFLYYSDGNLIKFPIAFRIFYKENGKMPWQRGKSVEHKGKNELAIDLLEWALKIGLPKSLVLADSWFCTGPFVKELKRLELSYILEVNARYTARIPCKEPKRTKTGRLAKKQYDLFSLPKIFNFFDSVIKYGFAPDPKIGKNQKVLYHTKVTTLRLNSIAGKHRVVESFDPTNQTTKYLLTDQLTWEAGKILSEYCNRWVIEEFFRNAKQLTDMEGATIRSEQGVTISICLVSWIDSLLHFENYKHCIAEELTKESLTIPSIIRQAKYENFKLVIQKVMNEEDFLTQWLKVEGENIYKKRKQRKPLVFFDEAAHRAT